MISSTISATKPKEPSAKVSSAEVTSAKVTSTEITSASASANVTSTGVNVATTTTTTATAPSTTTTAPSTAPTLNNPSLTTTTTNEEAVNSICEMGFPREEVIRALKASFNNPDRAVEYLTNGIPEIEEAGEDGDDSLNPLSSHSVDSNADLSDNPLAFFLKSPQFIQLRMVVQQDPRLLGPLLEQIAQGNPEIFELIKENQEAFMELIQTPLSESEMQIISQGIDSEAEGEGAEGEGEVDPTSVIQVTEEEQGAIERLMALGFDRPRVIEAYFACDKNETIAANFLFEHMNDEDF